MRAYIYASEGFKFEWRGSAYIEVAFDLDQADFFECVNVLDYEVGAPSISVEDFPAHCDRWITEYGPDYR